MPKKLQPKKQVKIISITAVPVSESETKIKAVLYALGSDNKVYWWDKSRTEWALFI